MKIDNQIAEGFPEDVVPGDLPGKGISPSDNAALVEEDRVDTETLIQRHGGLPVIQIIK